MFLYALYRFNNIYIHVRFITLDHNVEDVCLIKCRELSFISERKLCQNEDLVLCFFPNNAEAGVNTIPIKKNPSSTSYVLGPICTVVELLSYYLSRG